MRALLLAIPLCFAAASVIAADLPKVGDAAPEFQMTGTDGKVYSNKDFAGKQAVIIAWYPRAAAGGALGPTEAYWLHKGRLLLAAFGRQGEPAPRS